ncbi:MAG: hypothetical protein R3D57_07550 [Hyphomicrobiaceae bacterium]
MRTLPTTAKLYLRVAGLRRRLMLRYAAQRLALGVLAAIVLLVGLGLLNVALYLWLREPLGDIGAVLIVAGLHLVGGGLLAVLALRGPSSRELSALEEAEAAALDAVTTEIEGVAEKLNRFESRLESIGSHLALVPSALSTLSTMLRKSPTEDRET